MAKITVLLGQVNPFSLRDRGRSTSPKTIKTPYHNFFQTPPTQPNPSILQYIKCIVSLASFFGPDSGQLAGHYAEGECGLPQGFIAFPTRQSLSNVGGHSPMICVFI